MEKMSTESRFGYDFQRVVAEIFEAYGYSVSDYFRKLSYGENLWSIDILAHKGDEKLAIEVKAFKSKETRTVLISNALDALLERMASLENRYTPVLVISSIWDNPLYNESFDRVVPRAVIVDIQNLLYMVEGNSELRDRLVSLLPYSVDTITPKPPKFKFRRKTIHKSKVDDATRYNVLIHKLNTWIPKKGNDAEFERLCCDCLESIFSDDLALWNYQQKSNDGLFRFDLICKIKNDNTREFWRTAERFFNSKYIVFEFKNYKKPFTQQEVFTTVKYLYMKALRGVAIMISTNGADTHAKQAIRGILRDEGKLILSLDIEDLIRMITMKRDDEDPSDLLSERLDEMLIDLEK